jgi:hypothetical protein
VTPENGRMEGWKIGILEDGNGGIMGNYYGTQEH